MPYPFSETDKMYLVIAFFIFLSLLIVFALMLEFSKIDNEILDFFYKQYSKAIPTIGKYIVGTSKPYEYLVNSIDQFYTQIQLVELMNNSGFSNSEYRNLSNGVSAIHSGWKA